MALRLAHEGAAVIIHHCHARVDAEEILAEVNAFGGEAYIIQGDLDDPSQPAKIIEAAFSIGPLFALVNNASIFEPLSWDKTDLNAWNHHTCSKFDGPIFTQPVFCQNYISLHKWKNCEHPGLASFLATCRSFSVYD